jgi:pimeloyl-ACP methyl ester carboxylesterase
MNDLQNPAGERLDHHFHPAERRSTLVILAHGLTGNMDRPLLVALADGLSACGWPCLRISFSGNGGSQGRFEDSCITKQIADLKAVLDSVPDYVQIAYAGHSMGAAVGVLTAAEDLRIRALVSLAGMVRTDDFVEREFGGQTPGRDLMWDEAGCPLSENFVEDLKSIGDVLSAATTVTQPWLLVHGDADDLVPVKDSRDAHSAAVCSKKLLEIPGAGHSFNEASYPRIVDVMNAWLASHFGPE